MNKILYVSLFILLLSACQQDEANTYSIKGSIEILNVVFLPDIEFYYESITVTLFEGDNLIATSETENGKFEFKNLNEGKSYTIIPTSPGGSHNGLSAIDFIEIRKYISGTLNFDVIQKIAADVNKDGIIDQADLDLLQGCMVTQNDCPGWRFITAEYDAAGHGSIDQVTFSNLMADQEIRFIPVKLGDIN